ncbi:MAG: hypothetical protein NZ519_03535 [Bacteroidia bacterium]|nr:hypothetical protein [Bacteroidia bacterium]MDW8347715.1 hypothetical protein [Bacteroidia bacterium]
MRRVREQCEAPKRQRSPQHADLACMSAAKRKQGHAQKLYSLS